MSTYKPRRCSKRWLDGDCPDGVLCIMDDPRYTDRYTVFYKEVHEYDGRRYLFGRAMSEHPTHPQGVGLSIEMQAHGVAAYRYANKHRYCKWTDLPKAVQDCVRRDLEESK